MAGTVVLDDVELREAQRDYLDFLDDEVREALGREVPELGAWEGGQPREATQVAAPRRAATGGGRGQARRRRSLPPRSFKFPRGGVSR